MPDTRNVQSPYPRGQGFASVPVLFSLPNVQPLIAAASTGAEASMTARPGPDAAAIAEPAKAATASSGAATGGSAGFPEPGIPGSGAFSGISAQGATVPGASGPNVVNPLGSRSGSRLTSRITNATIGVLVVAVGFLAYRNYYSGHVTDPSGSQHAHDTLSLIPAPIGDSMGANTSVPAKTVSFPSDQPSGLNVPQAFPNDMRSMPVYPATPSGANTTGANTTSANPSAAAPIPETSSNNASAYVSSMPNSIPPFGPAPAMLNGQNGNTMGGANGERTATDPSSRTDLPSEAPSQKPAIPMLLQPPADNASKDASPKSASEENVAPPRSPYGSSTTPASLASTTTDSALTRPSPMPPAKLTAASTPTTTIDTETPTLNTRDIIMMRSGQRKAPSGSTTDPNSPKIESIPRSADGSRNPDPRGTGAALMSGQAYPPIAPLYEPISMNADPAAANRNRYQAIGTSAGPMPPANNRITQPGTATPSSAGATAEGQKPASVALPYQPLSPALPNPNDAIQFDDATP